MNQKKEEPIKKVIISLTKLSNLKIDFCNKENNSNEQNQQLFNNVLKEKNKIGN
jgi:molybdenum cofactor biosynthesis enzyme MoaA